MAIGLTCVLPFAVACPSPAAPVNPTPVAEGLEVAPRRSLERFLQAEKAQDWQTCYLLLSADLRLRYTPERLGADYRRDADLAHDKLARIQAVLAGGAAVVVEGDDHARLPLAADRAVQLVREPDGWHVASLE